MNDKTPWVLVDNDQLITSVWAMAAEMMAVDLRVFTSADALLNQLDALPTNTKFYIDSDLGDGLLGEDVCQQLSQQGFSEIYLCTGYPAEHFKPMPWIKAIVGKHPPFYPSAGNIIQ